MVHHHHSPPFRSFFQASKSRKSKLPKGGFTAWKSQPNSKNELWIVTNAGDNLSLCLIYDIHSCLLRFGVRFGWSTYLLSRWFGCVEFYFCIISRWWFQIFFYFHPYFGKISLLTNIFQMGWNHQPDMINQLIVTWWFGFVVWIPGIPWKERDCIPQGYPGFESQSTGPQPTKFLFDMGRGLLLYVDSAWRWRNATCIMDYYGSSCGNQQPSSPLHCFQTSFWETQIHPWQLNTKP